MLYDPFPSTSVKTLRGMSLDLRQSDEMVDLAWLYDRRLLGPRKLDLRTVPTHTTRLTPSYTVELDEEAQDSSEGNTLLASMRGHRTFFVCDPRYHRSCWWWLDAGCGFGLEGKVAHA